MRNIVHFGEKNKGIITKQVGNYQKKTVCTCKCLSQISFVTSYNNNN